MFDRSRTLRAIKNMTLLIILLFLYMRFPEKLNILTLAHLNLLLSYRRSFYTNIHTWQVFDLPVDIQIAFRINAVLTIVQLNAF